MCLSALINGCACECAASCASGTNAKVGAEASTISDTGQRRYRPEAVARVGVILLLTDVGFTLAEVGMLLASRAESPQAWHALAEAKVDELRRAEASAQLARTALEHAMKCPKDDIVDCPTFWALVGDRLAGSSLREPATHAAS